MSDRHLTFAQAIREALDLCMERDPSVYVIGLGVPDPKGIFGTTAGLQGKYGSTRVLDMPTAENGMTGVAIGSALAGMKPVLVHQRLDFALLTLEQIVNQAAKWHYMFGGKLSVPIVIRLIVGRGWGQGPQHSQSLQSWFAHVPGLKVVMPATPRDAKGLLIASIEDPNPVIFFENRWLHGVHGDVPEGLCRVPLGRCKIVRRGTDVTIVASSHMVLEAVRATDILADAGVSAEVVDVRTLRPLDRAAIVRSIHKTGRLIVVDAAWKSCGFGAEILAIAAEDAFDALKRPPVRLGLADCPTPTTPALSLFCYPQSSDIVAAACAMCDVSPEFARRRRDVTSEPHDVPDRTFTGPF